MALLILWLMVALIHLIPVAILRLLDQ